MRTNDQEKLMKTRFKQVALASAVTAAMGAASMPAHAIIEGAAGEALLVPFVVYAPGTAGAEGVNTLIEITIPSTVGFDTIPNVFTAPNTTPTNPGPTLFPADADLVKGNFIHWYFFDQYSVHRLNRAVKVTPDDMVLINWGDEVQNTGLVGVPGYLVVGTETARSGAAADFNMFGDAYLVSGGEQLTFRADAKIPVLPMSDGPDGPFGSPVTVQDQVKYKGGIPVAVSPLISGMRTNRSDGALDDGTVFDLTLSNRNFPTLHVVWLDVNLWDTFQEIIPVDVFDTDERTCSSTISLPWELNAIWIQPVGANTITPPLWATGIAGRDTIGTTLCLPTGAAATGQGFVRYQLPEYIDTNIDSPESAGVAFSIKYGTYGTAVPNILPVETALGHERGTYKL